ncbi:MAG: tetratricopeptide repeat protein [Desulfomonilaceae bacterium]
MAKLFKKRISPVGRGAIGDAREIASEALENAAETYGEDSVQAANSVLVLASIYYLNEDYGLAVPLFESYVNIVTRELGPESREVFDGLCHLINAYIGLGDHTDLLSITKRVSHVLKTLQETGGMDKDTDPLVMALLEIAVSCKDKGDEVSLRRGFVFAVMALSWCVTTQKACDVARVKIIPRLRELIMSFGIHRHGYAWLLRRSDQREHDFVGLLSVIDEEGVFSLKGFELEPFPELNID